MPPADFPPPVSVGGAAPKNKRDPRAFRKLAAAPVSVSSLLLSLRDSLGPAETVQLADLLSLFGVRGFAFLLMALALMNLAIFMLPGLSLLFGLPMIFFAGQMVLGQRRPLLPRFLTSREIPRDVLSKALASASDALRRIEPFLKPRLPFLTGPVLDRFHSGLALILSCLVALPLPFVNMPPSLALVFLGLGILQRDGVAILLSYGFAAWSFWIFSSLGSLARGFFAFGGA